MDKLLSIEDIILFERCWLFFLRAFESGVTPPRFWSRFLNCILIVGSDCLLSQPKSHPHSCLIYLPCSILHKITESIPISGLVFLYQRDISIAIHFFSCICPTVHSATPLLYRICFLGFRGISMFDQVVYIEGGEYSF